MEKGITLAEAKNIEVSAETKPSRKDWVQLIVFAVIYIAIMWIPVIVTIVRE